MTEGVNLLYSSIEPVKIETETRESCRKKEYSFDVDFLKAGKKIGEPDAKELKIWGALLSLFHTLLVDRNTWIHLTMLTVICFCSAVIVIATNSYKSNKDQNGRIQTLISFVFAGYIGIVINRWDRLCISTLGQIWGAIENLNMIAYRVLGPANEDSDKLKDLILRLGRLCFQLTFLAVQGDGELGHLVDRGLLTEKEKLWLDEATIGSRPMVVVDWIYSYFDMIREKGYKYGDPIEEKIHTIVQSLRGGVGATLDATYPYVRCVYWTVQVLLLALAVESGVLLATVWTKSNGNGEWSPPEHQNRDFWNFLWITVSNLMFALFCEGMLKICDKLSNPMLRDDTSFSEFVFNAFIDNTCGALDVGFISFRKVFAEDIAGIKA